MKYQKKIKIKPININNESSEEVQQITKTGTPLSSKPSRPARNRFEMVGVKLASPNRIREWSERRLPNGEIVGEIRKPDTMNYRTGRPEAEGLVCEKIFGPLKSWECGCGQYKFRPKHRPFYCPNCGVEVTESHVRRHRMGHVVLNYPVTHTWYLKGSPSYLSIILDQSLKDLETIVYLVNEEKTLEQLEQEARESVKQLLIFKANNKSQSDLDEPQAGLWLDEWIISNTRFSNEFNNYLKLQKEHDKNYFYLQNKKRSKKLKNSNSYQEVIYDAVNALLLAQHGSKLILSMLEELELPNEISSLRQQILTSTLSKRERLLKRLRLLETFVATQSEPSWMVLTVLPVLPPALRPVFELPNGTYMSSEFNEHYRRIVMRNNRLLRFCEQVVPDFIVINEKILIQDAVDDLIDNGSRFGRDSYGPRNKPLRCLNDLIAGKEGRFRQNLLGKRVDYSGRSVIVVGPTLMVDQCSLPYEMALDLFGPYLIYKIREIIPRARELDTTELKAALERNYPIVWIFLTLIVSMTLVLLNRAPTLHRLGIQAFRPILTTGRAIQLHPLVCPGFNADFDGDQMGVHLPLTRKTQLEAYRMLSSNNLLSPASGKPILTPGQDIVLGWYYLTTRTLKNLPSSNTYFTSFAEVSDALENKKLTIHSPIWVRYSGTLIGMKVDEKNLLRREVFPDNSCLEIFENIQLKKDSRGKIILCYICTTPGRILLNEIIGVAIQAKPIATTIKKTLPLKSDIDNTF
uniref:DNA-directed RNA polymerase subunit n=1 Tax=Eustigmatophyceae sp. Mont 10/10-1w TaxID=2506145 RepID=A0A451FMT8_9STRA|nr:RNA polymerase b'-subunit [Eustigmatophyceae sp. Mont 10/10-1w]QAA11732.1 RNA polymerase b'-subunit [Eustigmatophyceae sp. Mont 10/10-1w]